MRIAHICRVAWPQVGGMESAVRGLAVGLAGRGHTVRVISLGAASASVDEAGVEWVRRPRVGRRALTVASGLRAAVAGFDLVHVHGIDALLLQAAGCGLPMGVSTHGGPWHQARWARVKHAALRLAFAPVLRRAGAVWFSSESDQRQFSPYQVYGQVIPNGLTLQPLLAQARRPEAGRWLVPGRVDTHKGIDDLFAALAAVPGPKRSSTRLIVAGPEARPGLVAALGAQAQRLAPHTEVVFTGPLSEAAWREELARCAVAIFPSRAEGFGIAVVEAQAAGVPVLVSDIPAHRERVREGGSGQIVDLRAHDAGERLLRAAAHPPVTAEAARAAVAGFDWSVLLPLWEREYARVLA